MCDVRRLILEIYFGGYGSVWMLIKQQLCLLHYIFSD